MPLVIHYASGQIDLPEEWDAGPVTSDLVWRLYNDAVARDGWLELETSDGRPNHPNDGGLIRLQVGPGIPFGVEWRRVPPKRRGLLNP